jgi:RNA polymerase sigma-70 factor (ECF subfamily)
VSIGGESHTGEIADLFDALSSRLFRYALSLCKTVDRADDLVQEAFLRALRHASTLAAINTHQREAWLKRTLRNCFFDEQRRQRRAATEILEGIREAQRPPAGAGLAQLNDILDQVPEAFRNVLEKRYRLGMNSSEIGRELGIPAATVRSQLHQAIRWLREEWAKSIR